MMKPPPMSGSVLLPVSSVLPRTVSVLPIPGRDLPARAPRPADFFPAAWLRGLQVAIRFRCPTASPCRGQPGADFVLQLHLHPSGKPEREQSTIGFHLTDEPPQRSMADLLLNDMKIDIPPGERSYRDYAAD
jgi:hypothetical protein